MKTRIEEVLVVEGHTDVDFLSHFIEGEIVTTNGSDVPRETIEYLKSLSKTKKIIVLTDPDTPGKRIRDILDREISGLCHAFIPKASAIKKGKVGVAESNEQEVMRALSHLLEKRPSKVGILTLLDLFDLGLVGTTESFALRQKVCDHFHVGFANGKTLLKRLNILCIEKEQLSEFLKEGEKPYALSNRE
jgi:ribonuclease M5